ncbi:MAG: type II toxin-antitoxin system RelE/ParE family toxin [Papillibacter sp.]|nr:type II toxin-antitoxin system RelE/ParE family toxin [Papillibacter sp.]
MEYKLKYLPASHQNLKDIISHLSKFYPSTAPKFVSNLRRCIDNLRTQPYMYSVYEDYPAYRHTVIGDYILFYVVNEADRTVEIHRILHGKQNIQRIISENIPDKNNKSSY